MILGKRSAMDATAPLPPRPSCCRKLFFDDSSSTVADQIEEAPHQQQELRYLDFVRTALTREAYRMSDKYNFDFTNDRPLLPSNENKAQGYDWSYSANCPEFYFRNSTNASGSASASMSEPDPSPEEPQEASTSCTSDELKTTLAEGELLTPLKKKSKKNETVEAKATVDNE